MKRFLPGIFITLAFFLIGIATVKDYGMHEDSPFHFLRGQSYLQQLLTGVAHFNGPTLHVPVLFAPGQRISTYKPNASEELLAPLRPISNIADSDTPQLQYKKYLKTVSFWPSFYQSNSWTSNIWDLPENQGHPGVSDILMAGVNRIVYGYAHILGDVESYHLYIIITSAVGILFLYLFTLDIFGQTAAIIASCTLIFYPYFFSESHFNIKDPIQMSFYTVAVVSFYFFVTRRLSKRWFITCVIAVFLALGTKWNIVFVPLILLPWLFIIRKHPIIRTHLTLKPLLIFGTIGIVAPVVLLIAAYPFYWSQTFYKLLNTVNFYMNLAVSDPRVQAPSYAPLPLGLDGRAFLRILTMTPPVILVAFAAGWIAILFGKIKTKYRTGLLVGLWFAVPLLRVIWQTSELLGSIRNFIEFLPALAVVSGIGVSWAIDSIARRLPGSKKITVSVLCVGVYIIILSIPEIRLHPNENLYFNFLTTTLPQSKQAGLQMWETSYDNPYRQAVNWFNANAPQNATIAHLDGTMLAISPEWLRSDIRIGSFFSGFDKKGEYIISLVYPSPPSVFLYHYLDRFLTPIWKLNIKGTPILRIWKNDAAHTKPAFSSEHAIIPGKVHAYIDSRGKRLWDITFPQIERVTRIRFRVPVFGCIGREQGVWSVVTNDGKETLIRPLRTQLEPLYIENDFPAFPGNTIRFWDVEGDGCLNTVTVEQVYGL